MESNIKNDEKLPAPLVLLTNDQFSLENHMIEMMNDPQNYPNIIAVQIPDKDFAFSILESLLQSSENDFIISCFNFQKIEILESIYCFEVTDAEHFYTFFAKEYGDHLIKTLLPINVFSVFCNQIVTTSIINAKIVRFQDGSNKRIGFVKSVSPQGIVSLYSIPILDYNEMIRSRIYMQSFLNRKNGPDYKAPFNFFDKVKLSQMGCSIKSRTVEESHDHLISVNVWDHRHFYFSFEFIKVETRQISIILQPFTTDEIQFFRNTDFHSIFREIKLTDLSFSKFIEPLIDKVKKMLPKD